MTFSRQRAVGAWDGTLTEEELDTWDTNIANAIDGEGGGTYAPATAIAIGGEGLEVSGLLKATDVFEFDGTSFVVSASTITLFAGDVTFDGGEVEFQDPFTGAAATFSGTVQAATLTATGDVNVGDDLVVTDRGVFNGEVDFNEVVRVHMPVGGGFVINGSGGDTHYSFLDSFGFVARQAISLVDNGRIKYRVTNATDADATFSVSTSDFVVVVNDNTITGTRDWTIDNVGAVDGMIITLSRWPDDGDSLIAVKRSDGSVILYLGYSQVGFPGPLNLAEFTGSCRLVRTGGKWELLERHSVLKAMP